ncbi:MULTISPECIES: dTDP-4-dehydrorhamnose 3,5-epimerase [unclassified Pseudomonas]|uniref:dTDP-4-dehydrorhamnose 3,5-epimerase n=1 Tax=unclassified Pseudomonas TaxID=196821 RepID=UPI00385EB099
MKFYCAELPDIVIIEPDVFEDERGWLMESFNQLRFDEGLKDLGVPKAKIFVQDNHSLSKKDVLRGLHYQVEPFAQGKLVSVTKGAVFDVAVDIRPASPTYGQWFGTELNEINKKMLWIPAGFAHGFLALEDDTHFNYKVTDFYNKDSERSIRWDDSRIAIKWPIRSAYIINEKDKLSPCFNGA